MAFCQGERDKTFADVVRQNASGGDEVLHRWSTRRPPTVPSGCLRCGGGSCGRGTLRTVATVLEIKHKEAPDAKKRDHGRWR